MNDEYELEWHLEPESEFVEFTQSSTNPFAFTLTGVVQGQATIHLELIKEHSMATMVMKKAVMKSTTVSLPTNRPKLQLL